MTYSYINSVLVSFSCIPPLISLRVRSLDTSTTVIHTPLVFSHIINSKTFQKRNRADIWRKPPSAFLLLPKLLSISIELHLTPSLKTTQQQALDQHECFCRLYAYIIQLLNFSDISEKPLPTIRLRMIMSWTLRYAIVCLSGFQFTPNEASTERSEVLVRRYATSRDLHQIISSHSTP